MTFGEFGDTPTKSTPLEEALQPEDIEEFTEEELAVINLGIDASYSRTWNRVGPGKEGKKLFNHNKYESKNLTKGFFEWYLDRVNFRELKNVDLEILPEKLRDMAISQINLMSDTPRELERLELENEALKKQLVDVVNGKGTKTLKGLQEELDKVYKEKAKVQEERDEVINSNQKTLKILEWLYDFMGEHMEAIDLSKIEVFDSDALKSIENAKYQPTKKEIEIITQIKELVKND